MIASPHRRFATADNQRPKPIARMTMLAFSLCALSIGAASFGHVAETYRTDGGDEKLQWLMPTPGEFPPGDAAHTDYATLVSVDESLCTRIDFDFIDYVKNPALSSNLRTGVYRLDRQVSDFYARKYPFTLLPYAIIRYRGAPAELEEYPPRTHLRLRMYNDYSHRGQGFFNLIAECSDDFSVSMADGWTYHIDEIKSGGKRIVVSRQGGNIKAEDKARIEFLIDDRTQLWKGRGVADAKDLAVGQSVIINQVPGQVMPPVCNRCADIWIDEESRTLATARQRAKQRIELMGRGLPGYVVGVDKPAAQITVTFFDCGYPEFLKDFQTGKRASLVCANEYLMPSGSGAGKGALDIIPGEALRITAISSGIGSSGVQVVFGVGNRTADFQLAGVVRVCPDGSQGMRFASLPPEERADANLPPQVVRPDTKP